MKCGPHTLHTCNTTNVARKVERAVDYPDFKMQTSFWTFSELARVFESFQRIGPSQRALRGLGTTLQ